MEYSPSKHQRSRPQEGQGQRYHQHEQQPQQQQQQHYHQRPRVDRQPSLQHHHVRQNEDFQRQQQQFPAQHNQQQQPPPQQQQQQQQQHYNHQQQQQPNQHLNPHQQIAKRHSTSLNDNQMDRQQDFSSTCKRRCPEIIGQQRFPQAHDTRFPASYRPQQQQPQRQPSYRPLPQTVQPRPPPPQQQPPPPPTQQQPPPQQHSQNHPPCQSTNIMATIDTGTMHTCMTNGSNCELTPRVQTNFCSPGSDEDPNFIADNIMVDWIVHLADPPVSENLKRTFNRPNPALKTKIEDYKLVEHLGRGTFGEVSRCARKDNPSLVRAIKRVFLEMDHDGFPITTLREIRILLTTHHPNIVKLYDVMIHTIFGETRRDTFYLSFECCEFDLCNLINNNTVKIELHEISSIAHQLLTALEWLQVTGVLHRDLKPANIFINNKGKLKVGDFGLAKLTFTEKYFDDQALAGQCHTVKVVTLWYRAPEILMGCNTYCHKVDVWSAACVISELFRRKPLFRADAELELINQIAALCGPMTDETWPALSTYPLYTPIKFDSTCKRQVKEEMRKCSEFSEFVDLLDKMLVPDPGQRCDASDALQHDAFFCYPQVESLTELVKRQLNSSGYKTYIERKKRAMEAARLHRIHQQHNRDMDVKRSEIVEQRKQEPQKPPRDYYQHHHHQQQQHHHHHQQQQQINSSSNNNNTMNNNHHIYKVDRKQPSPPKPNTAHPITLSSNKRNAQMARKRANERSNDVYNRDYSNTSNGRKASRYNYNTNSSSNNYHYRNRQQHY